MSNPIDDVQNPFEGNEENPYVSRVENPFGNQQEADPQHRVYRQSSQPPSTSLFAWHNILALVIIGIFVLTNLGGLVGDLAHYEECSGSSTRFSSYCNNEYDLTGSIISFIYTAVVVTIMVIALIRTNNHISSLRRRRTTINWATWGYFLLGIGPVIALVRTFRERSKADEEVTTTNWQSPNKRDKDIFGHLE